MAAQTRNVLKGYFNTGDQPSEANFADLVDSVPNLTDDGTTGSGSYVRATAPTLAGVTINADKINIGTEKTPATAGAAGTKGDVCWDASYIYVCVATNTWKRVAIATW